METGKWSVYIHKNNINGKVYIGTTKQLVEKRWKNGLGYYKQPHFYNDIKEHGWNNFTHEVVQEGLFEPEAKKLEIFLISQYEKKNLYNLTNGGDGSFGYKATEETKKKLRIIQSEKARRWKDQGIKYSVHSKKKDKPKEQTVFKTHEERFFSEETRIKISKAKKGRGHTEETKKKISEAGKGRCASPETRHKQSVAMTGRKMPREGVEKRAASVRKPLYQIDKNTNEIINRYSCVREVYELTKISQGNIRSVCNGRRNIAGGFKWKYVEDFKKAE